MSKKLLIESQYLPPIEYFCLLARADEVMIEKEENFVKQTYRNRCYILGPNKEQPLIVPVEHREKNMGEVRINYKNKWWHEHWRSLEAAYNKSAYMFYYKEELQSVYYSKPEKLIDLNSALLTFCLDKLSISVSVSYSNKYEKKPDASVYSDLRGVISPKRPFIERGIYREHGYFQQFGKAFVPNLSIIDLLMSMGPEAKSVIFQSVKEK